MPTAGRAAQLRRRGSVPRGSDRDDEPDTQRPALGRSHQPIDLLRGRLDALPRPQNRRALRGVEGKVRGGELAQPAGGTRLGNAELERPAAGDGDVQRWRLRPDELAEQPQRTVGAVEMLAVVDDEYQRLDQQPGQLGQQFTRGREHVDLLGRGGQAFGHASEAPGATRAISSRIRSSRTPGALSVTEQLIHATGPDTPLNASSRISVLP